MPSQSVGTVIRAVWRASVSFSPRVSNVAQASRLRVHRASSPGGACVWSSPRRLLWPKPAGETPALRAQNEYLSPHPRLLGLGSGTAAQIPLVAQPSAPFHWRKGRREARGEGCFRALGLVTVQVVGQESRLPHRASRPRWLDRGRDALMTGEKPAPLPEQLPNFFRHSVLPSRTCVLRAVAQISNLLYRSAFSLRGVENSTRLGNAESLPIGNRRYGRLQICATPNTYCGPMVSPGHAYELKRIFKAELFCYQGGWKAKEWEAIGHVKRKKTRQRKLTQHSEVSPPCNEGALP